MELRFLHGDFGNIKYKLQYKSFPVEDWKDVPVVEDPYELMDKLPTKVGTWDSSKIDEPTDWKKIGELSNKPVNNKLVENPDEEFKNHKPIHHEEMGPKESVPLPECEHLSWKMSHSAGKVRLFFKVNGGFDQAICDGWERCPICGVPIKYAKHFNKLQRGEMI